MRARVTRTCCPMHISLPLFLSEIFLPGHEILGVASKASYCFQLWIWPQGGVVVKFGTESNNFRAKMMIGEPRPFTLFTPIYVAFLLRSVALMIWGHLYDSESLYALLCSKFLLSKKIFFFSRENAYQLAFKTVSSHPLFQFSVSPCILTKQKLSFIVLNGEKCLECRTPPAQK